MSIITNNNIRIVKKIVKAFNGDFDSNSNNTSHQYFMPILKMINK